MQEQTWEKLLETFLGRFPSDITSWEKRALLRSFSNYSNEFIILRGVHGNSRFVSNSCKKLTGYNPNEFLSNHKLLEQIIAPEDLEFWRHKHRDNSYHDNAIHVRLIKRDGSIAWFEHNCFPLLNENGTFLGYAGNFIDVTALKQAEASAHNLAIAMEQHTTGVAFTDQNGVIEYVNPRFNKLLPQNEQVAPGDTLALLAAESGKSKEILAAASKQHDWREDVCIHVADSDDQWLTIKVVPIFDTQQQLSNYLVFKIDITQSVLARHRAIEQHNKLQHLFKLVEASKQEWEHSLDCINDAVILIDKNGNIKRSNKAIQQLFDVDVTTVIGTNWRLLLPEEMADQTGIPSEGEYYDRLRDKWFYYNVFPFSGDSFTTKVTQVVTFHDVSETWRITRELADAYDQQKAAQSQLVHQEKMASIGQLAAGVAHEINNPTGFITSNLTSLGKYTTKLNDHITFLEQALQQHGDDQIIDAMQQQRKRMKLSFIQEDIKDLVAESLEGAERIKVIVQNLKSFSRVDDTGLSNADLHECLDAALSIGWNEIKYKATVVKDYQPIPPVFCSAQQLNQVFLNLLVNAAQSLTEQGEIKVATREQSPWVIIEISDNGSGIAKEHLSRIFDPFFTTKEVGQGTGLGLSICYDIIKQHHGEISVSSKVGVGTTFTIKLPIVAPSM